ncbi:MAG: aldo/keto reductase [Acidobacteriota bacterium]|nr:aldo/keto reductase [Acidobacteriota bacterium]
MPLDFIYGTAWKEAETARLTLLALRSGFRAIDTANQRKHYFEAAVGEGLGAAYDAGLVAREDLFLQTKFTYRLGQDDRLPFDPAAPLTVQVAQSMASSLDHLRTTYVDCYVLHGPASAYEWTGDDSDAWAAMRKERDAGRALRLGVSNAGIWHLERMLEKEAEAPAFVQNRCFARTGWDRKVRAFCREHGIAYQAFSLLTANRAVLESPLIAGIAKRESATPAQVVFRFARAAGMIPLTGTSDAGHMQQDLASETLNLTGEEIEAIEAIAE